AQGVQHEDGARCQGRTEGPQRSESGQGVHRAEGSGCQVRRRSEAPLRAARAEGRRQVAPSCTRGTQARAVLRGGPPFDVRHRTSAQGRRRSRRFFYNPMKGSPMKSIKILIATAILALTGTSAASAATVPVNQLSGL